MLPVLLFIALWIVLAIGLVLIAMRAGGLSAARARLRRPSRGGSRMFGVTILVIYAGFGIAVPLGFLTGNHRNASGHVGNVTLTAGEKQGRELFGQHCGVCHTLAATNSIGKVGPNLDMLQPPSSLVLHTIQYGCVQNPVSASSPTTCLGYGTMPADVIQGQMAQEVANFVGAVAGKE